MSNEFMKLKFDITHFFFFNMVVWFIFIGLLQLLRSSFFRQLFTDLDSLIRSVVAACVSLEGMLQSQKPPCCLGYVQVCCTEL